MESEVDVHCGCFADTYRHNDQRYNLIKEQISISYLRALASFLGAQLTINGPFLDSEGIDLTLKLPSGRISGIAPSPSIDIQMKSTSCPHTDFSGFFLQYDLDVRTYTDMRRIGMSPCILMVLIQPDVVEDWVRVDSEGLIVPRFMLWYNPSDSDKEPSEGQETIRLNIPLKNRVDTESLHAMLVKAANQEMIRNESH